MIKLSVNINKIATIRNARGGASPSVIEAAVKCQEYGAHGITVHPRPDERHISYQDVRELRPVVSTEFNIEGNPQYLPFIDLVLEVLPEQVTLVPDQANSITSNAGWDTILHQDYLKKTIALFKTKGIRTSLFLDPNPELIESAASCGADRIELYTEAYALDYASGKIEGILAYQKTAQLAKEKGLGVNAGHDLNLSNIEYLAKELKPLDEVSIGHALISEALYLGLDTTIKKYLAKLNP